MSDEQQEKINAAKALLESMLNQAKSANLTINIADQEGMLDTHIQEALNDLRESTDETTKSTWDNLTVTVQHSNYITEFTAPSSPTDESTAGATTDATTAKLAPTTNLKKAEDLDSENLFKKTINKDGNTTYTPNTKADPQKALDAIIADIIKNNPNALENGITLRIISPKNPSPELLKQLEQAAKNNGVQLTIKNSAGQVLNNDTALQQPREQKNDGGSKNARPTPGP